MGLETVLRISLTVETPSKGDLPKGLFDSSTLGPVIKEVAEKLLKKTECVTPTEGKVTEEKPKEEGAPKEGVAEQTK